MKTAWITILYQTPPAEVERLQKEVASLDSSIDFLTIDNTQSDEGYAAGVNKGIKQAGIKHYDYFIISNPDISLSKLQGKEIYSAAEHFDIWGYSFLQNAKMYYGGELDPWVMSGGLITKKPKERFTPCDFVSGSLMVIKREVIEKIGLFDESYQMYYEDVDYCIRASQAGFRVGVDTEQQYEHFETSDTNPQKEEYLHRNRLKILGKYGTIKHRLYGLAKLIISQ